MRGITIPFYSINRNTSGLLRVLPTAIVQLIEVYSLDSLTELAQYGNAYPGRLRNMVIRQLITNNCEPSELPVAALTSYPPTSIRHAWPFGARRLASDLLFEACKYNLRRLAEVVLELCPCTCGKRKHSTTCLHAERFLLHAARFSSFNVARAVLDFTHESKRDKDKLLVIQYVIAVKGGHVAGRLLRELQTRGK